MSTLSIKQHPYITSDSSICGGKPIIAGTRIRVIDIAIRYELGGMSPDEIIQDFPTLSLPQIHDALSFYYERKHEIDLTVQKEEELIASVRARYRTKR